MTTFLSSNRTEQQVIRNVPRVVEFTDGTVVVDFETGALDMAYHDGSARVVLYPEGEMLDALILKLQALRTWQIHHPEA